MPRGKRKITPAEPPVVEPIVESPVEQGGNPPAEPPRQTYPVTGQETRDLTNRAQDFLERTRAEVDSAEQKLAESTQPETSDKGTQSPPPAVRQTPAVPAVSKGDTAGKGGAVKTVANDESANKKSGRNLLLILILLAAVIFYAGVQIGVYHGRTIPKTVYVATGTGTQSMSQQGYSVKNIAPSDEQYGIKMEVLATKHRVDGLYVVFKVTNGSQKPVYFMGNTIKMVGSDGKVYLPDLSQGDIPQTFTGGGLPPSTSDEATLVFNASQDVEPKQFILENVTNLVNGSWSFEVDCK